MATAPTRSIPATSEFRRQLAGLQQGDHLCLIYADPVEQMAGAVPFIMDGLKAGERCVYLADDRTAKEATTALAGAGVDVQAEYGRGALHVLTQRDAYLRSGQFEPGAMIEFLRKAMDAALAEGFAGLRVSGEMTWALGPEGDAERLIEYEALASQFFLGSHALAVCQYNRQQFSAAIMRSVLRTHRLAVLENQVCLNPYYEPQELVLEGEPEATRVEWMLEQLKRAQAAELEQRRRELEFQTLAEHSPDIIARFNRELRHVYVNPAIVAATGMEPQAFIGKTNRELGLPEDKAGWWEEQLHQVFATGQERTIEFDFPTPSGTRYYQSRLVPELSPDGSADSVLGITRDITQRKRAEDALALYREIIANSSEAIAIIDPQGRYLEQNAAHRELIGYSDEELRGQTPALHFGEESFATIAEELNRTGRFQGELVSHTKSGSAVDIDLSAFVVHDEAGTPICYVGIKRDITERKRAQEQRLELLAREQAARAMAEAVQQRYRSLVDSIEAIVWDADPKTLQFTFVSQRAEAMLGYPVQQWLSEPNFWANHIHPEDREQTLGHFLAAVGAGVDHELEYRTVAADGRSVWLRALVRVVADEQGQPRQLYGVMVDITTHKQAEEALRDEAHLIETLHRVGAALVAELDREKVLQAVTDAATELSGAQFGAFFYNVVNEEGEAYMLYTLSGAPREVFAQFPMPRNTALFEPTFGGQGVVRLDDVTQDPRYGTNAPYYGTPPGHLPVVSYLAVPVVSRSGAVLGGLFFGHPEPRVFTERAERLVVGIAAQAAIALDNARLYEEAQQAVQAKNDFLAIVSHDLKNPLGAIKGQAQLLRRRLARAHVPDSERLVQGLVRIDTTTTKMTRLIEELLDVARLEMGEPLPLNPRPTDLVALAEQAAGEYQQTTEQHQLRVEAEEQELTGYWDGARLERVLDNLLSNAVKYSPEGGEITLRVGQEVNEDTAWAVLEIRDRGVGIPAAELPTLFERFRRASNVVGSVSGHGLGLAGARQVVEQHGGTIAVDSQEGLGTRVTVRLPLAAGVGHQGSGVSE